jgi:hypothetical protein
MISDIRDASDETSKIIKTSRRQGISGASGTATTAARKRQPSRQKNTVFHVLTHTVAGKDEKRHRGREAPPPATDGHSCGFNQQVAGRR